MKTADEYLQEIADAMGATYENGEMAVSFHWETKAEAKMMRKEFVYRQKVLRTIKQSVNTDMKIIRTHYTEKKGNASAGLLGLLAGRRAAGQIRAVQKRTLRREELEALSPYENVKRAIDNFILQLDKAKDDVDLDLATRQDD